MLVIAPWARRLGGAEEMLWAFLRTYDRALLTVDVAFLEAGPFEAEVAALGVRTSVVDAGRLRSPLRVARTVAALAGVVRRRRPRVVLNWMAKTQLYGAPAALLSRRRPRVVWWQHLVPDRHWMDRLATALPAAAIGSSSAASAAAQRGLRPRRPTFVVHPGIDRPEATAGGPSRSALGLSEAAVVVTLVGRLQPWKGHETTLRALARLRADGHDVQLLFVGGAAFGFDVGHRATLERLAGELGLAAHVVFTGQVPSAHPYLRLTDIALNASAEEPFGIVVLEALANGVACVAVGSGGPAEILVDGETGVLAAGGSPGALAAALGRLVTDEELRAAVARRGREHHERHFTAAAMSRRLTDHLVAVAR